MEEEPDKSLGNDILVRKCLETAGWTSQVIFLIFVSLSA